jgi:hypothetical protein
MKKTMAKVCWLAKAKFSPSLFLFLSLFFVCFFTVSPVFFSTSSFPWFFTRFLLFRYVFCVFRSGNRVRSPDLFSLNCLLRGLSLAFIKPENVMRSPSNMKRTLRTVTVVMETHRGARGGFSSSWSGLLKKMSVLWNGAVLFLNWYWRLLIVPLKFWLFAIGPLFMENPPLNFLILPLDKMQLDSWILASFTKKSLVSELFNSVLNWLFNF